MEVIFHVRERVDVEKRYAIGFDVEREREFRPNARLDLSKLHNVTYVIHRPWLDDLHVNHARHLQSRFAGGAPHGFADRNIRGP